MQSVRGSTQTKHVEGTFSQSVGGILFHLLLE
jgi:hypothetical protein